MHKGYPHSVFAEGFAYQLVEVQYFDAVIAQHVGKDIVLLLGQS